MLNVASGHFCYVGLLFIWHVWIYLCCLWGILAIFTLSFSVAAPLWCIGGGGSYDEVFPYMVGYIVWNILSFGTIYLLENSVLGEGGIQ